MKEYFVSHKVHKIDQKGRISIPSNMRSLLGNEFIVSRGFGKCLALYPMEEWHAFMQKIIETVNQNDRKKLEFYFSANAEKMSLDGQGRLYLNEDLRNRADLSDAEQAVVFGNNKRIEIWNCDLFNAQLEAIDDKTAEDLLDKYGI